MNLLKLILQIESLDWEETERLFEVLPKLAATEEKPTRGFTPEQLNECYRALRDRRYELLRKQRP